MSSIGLRAAPSPGRAGGTPLGLCTALLPAPPGGASPGQGASTCSPPSPGPGPLWGCLSHPPQPPLCSGSSNPATRPDSQPSAVTSGAQVLPMLCECRGPCIRDSGWTPFPVCSVQLGTSDAPHQGQEALPEEGRQAGQASAPGVEARAKSGAIFPLPVPRHRGEQRDGPAAGRTPLWGAEPTETAAHGTHTCHCLEQLQEELLRDGLQTLAVKARALTCVRWPAGGREMKQRRKAAVSPDQGPTSVEDLNTSTKRQEVGRVG